MLHSPHNDNPLITSASRYLAERTSKRMFRRLATAVDGPLKDLSSNDYLGLSRHPEVIDAAQLALARFGAGSAASPVLSCRHNLNEQLTETMGPVLPKGWGCVFVSSGYAANAVFFDTLRLLGAPIDLFIDHRSHASIITGARSSGLRSFFFPHRDYDRLERSLARSSAEARIIVIESLHSMDGDCEPCEQLARLCRLYPGTSIYIDEAHSAGTFGYPSWILSQSRYSDIVPFLAGIMIGCGKTLGAAGGILCLPDVLRQTAVQGARPLVYSTAPAPATLAAVNAALQIVLRDGPDLARSLQSLIWRFKDQLEIPDQGGLSLHNSSPQAHANESHGPLQVVVNRISSGERADGCAVWSPIVTLRAQSSRDPVGSLFSIHGTLLRRGFATALIRPPTVPAGSECLRMSFTLDEVTAVDRAAGAHNDWPENLGRLVRSLRYEAQK